MYGVTRAIAAGRRLADLRELGARRADRDNHSPHIAQDINVAAKAGHPSRCD